MKMKDNKSEAGLMRYVFVSIVAHIVIIYIVANFVGEKPAFQIYPLEYYSEVQVVHYDDQLENDQNKAELEEEPEEDLVEVEEEKEVEEDLTTTEEDAESTEPEEGTELDEEVLTSEESEEEIKVNEEDEEIEDEEIEDEEIEDEEIEDEEIEDEEIEDEEIEDEEIEDEEIEDEEIEDEEIEDEEIEDEEIEDEEIEDEEIEDEEIEDEEIEDEEAAPPPVARDFIATKITPSYPKDAANLAQEGTVRLLVTVKSNGEVKDVEILESAENSQFNNVAELTVERGWQFKQAESDYQIELNVDFNYIDQQSNVELEFIDLFFVEE
ncbi:energy transducer TonB [Natroniella sp. ANB-PHB2]|uniref:energy transducer TonB n=1 Tax=Natroniella sp. ANB-PHB2 TaxID=3384444 RepID=UPI0038D420C3